MGEVVAKPCPFCGGTPKVYQRGSWGVKCTCHGKAFIHHYGTDRAAAVEAWNRRALDLDVIRREAREEALREAAEVAEVFVEFGSPIEAQAMAATIRDTIRAKLAEAGPENG